jgi:hypothetical protein
MVSFAPLNIVQRIWSWASEQPVTGKKINERNANEKRSDEKKESHEELFYMDKISG